MKKFINEFKEFIAGGNMIEFAVAVILAGAIGKVINAFTEGVMMPIVAAIFGQPDFDALAIDIGDAKILYGTVITAFVTLVLTGLVLFADHQGVQQDEEAGRRGGRRPDRGRTAHRDPRLPARPQLSILTVV